MNSQRARNLILSAAAGTLIAIAAVVALVTPAFAQEMHWGWRVAWGGWFALVFWGGIILLFVLLVRAYSRSERADAAGDRALDILKERFARGEIDHAEYEARRKVLETPATPPGAP